MFKVKHFHVKSPDPRKTANWWVENLGATIVAQDEQGTHFTLELDGITFNVGSLVKDQTRRQSYGLEHIGLAPDDFETAAEKLKHSGARILETTKTGTLFIETAEGVQLEVSRKK